MDGVKVELNHERKHSLGSEEYDENDRTMLDVIHREIELKGDLSDEQRQRLLSISHRCPVHRTLTEGAKIIDEMHPMD